MTLLLRAVAALLLLAAPAFAQTWPAKQVRIVVPFPAGGSADILCRLVGEKFSAAWGQTVIIDNRAGAGGNVGAEVVYRAEPDGYTLLCSPPGPLSINHNLYKTLPYDWSKFSAIGVLALVPNVITARPDLPQASLKDFIAYAKANPGKATYASQGNGSTSHLSASMLATLAGIELVHVPYKGEGPALVDLTGSRVDIFIGNISAALRFEKAKQARFLGSGQPHAQPGRAGRADHRRARLSGPGVERLVRPGGAARHARRRRAEGECRPGQGARASPSCARGSSSSAPSRKAARRPPRRASSRTRKRAGAASSSRPM